MTTNSPITKYTWNTLVISSEIIRKIEIVFFQKFHTCIDLIFLANNSRILYSKKIIIFTPYFYAWIIVLF